MTYIEALELVHQILNPTFYVEIGCRNGKSLSLATCPSVAIDPLPEINQEIKAPFQLFAETSDSFFKRNDLHQILQRSPDLSFIDGMHLVEFALRDFINLEKICNKTSVILIDDVLPSNIDWATRERKTQYWTGDVYRLIPILRKYRPDLVTIVFEIKNQGLAVISNLNPDSKILPEKLAEINKQIDSGDWICNDIDELQNLISPIKDFELRGHLKQLSNLKTNDAYAFKEPQKRYLELLKKSLLNEIYLDDELRIHYLKDCLKNNLNYSQEILHDIRTKQSEIFADLYKSREVGQFLNKKIENSGFSHTMMGRKRLNNLHYCLDYLRLSDVKGDFIECGVWRGGGCIFMSGYVETYNMHDRHIYVADSFEGLPKPSLEHDQHLDLSKEKYPQLAISLEMVKQNFINYDLLTNNIIFVKGWFKNTLKGLNTDQIALLRLDGDLFESTMDILLALYDRVVEGGIIIVDDFALKPCRKAIEEFFYQRNEIFPRYEEVDWTGIWWLKR